MGVSNENLGVFNANRSLTKIWGRKSAGLKWKSWGLQRKYGDLQRKSGVSNKTMGVSNENLRSSMKIWGIHETSLGVSIVLQWWWFLPRLMKKCKIYFDFWRSVFICFLKQYFFNSELIFKPLNDDGSL